MISTANISYPSFRNNYLVVYLAVMSKVRKTTMNDPKMEKEEEEEWGTRSTDADYVFFVC